MSQEAAEVHAAAQAAARRGYGKLVAFLSARTHDVAGAEDALADAFEAALRDWPRNGVPAVPEAWLLVAARRKLIDAARGRQRAGAVAGTLAIIGELMADETDPAEIPDERLRLMFACAHPAIDAALRAPLILQVILGFDAATIASAFLVAPGTMAQRLVRAKHKIQRAGIPLEIPDRHQMAERVDAVLAAVYAAFSEGWSDPAGTEPHRRNLAEEGLWLGRLLVSLLPDEPEGLGLLALMLYAEARRSARRSPAGDYVPLAEQDPALWDPGLIRDAEALLTRAGTLQRPGRFQLEAALQSAHVVRRHTGSADWQAVVSLYDALLQMTDSPVVALNRAVALAEAQGTAAGLAALQALGEDSRLAQYQPYWAALAQLSGQAGQCEQAARAFDLAIGLEADPAVRRFLLARRLALLG